MLVNLNSNQREFLSHKPGIPEGLLLENLPSASLRVLQKVRFVTAQQLDWLDRQVTEVYLDNEVFLKTGRTKGGQILQWTRKQDEKRGPDTNLALNGRRPTSKPVVL